MNSPKFTRKTYRIIATMIGESKNLEDFTSNIAHFFRVDNRRFDADRFYSWIEKVKDNE